MDKTVNHGNTIARAYDKEAEASGWFGPEMIEACRSKGFLGQINH